MYQTAYNGSLSLPRFCAQLVGESWVELVRQLNTKPPWPNGQGAPLLRVRLWVRVPLGVFNFFFLNQAANINKKNNTPCGTQTHNLQIRSLTRCSIAPTGPVWKGPRANKDHFIFVGDTTNQPMKKMLQEGLEPPTLGLLDPCSTKLSYQSSTLHTLGIEPRTFT